MAGKSISINNGLISDKTKKLSPKDFFEEVDVDNFYEKAIKRLNLKNDNSGFILDFEKSLNNSYKDTDFNNEISMIVSLLTDDFPLIIQKLNILLYIKKFKKEEKPLEFAKYIKNSAQLFIENRDHGFYFNAYGHYAVDLFSQICKNSSSGIGVVYAGFDTIIKMTSSNPRNLLIILGKIYDVASFRGVDFLAKDKVSLEIQTEAVLDSARFMYEADTNFGLESDIALRAIDRLAAILRTARFAMNIPEVSPLAFSFSNDDLSNGSKKILQDALNFSLLFEITDGRADRNSEKIIRKVQLNPMLSPKWSLPVSRRGDISLNKELLAAVFTQDSTFDFDHHLKRLNIKWNSITKPLSSDNKQGDLFK
ncbi:hypothetical protein H4F63_21260 [Pectobacterium brasiliense]|nr:hypothetical protein [Pectobacterium brasiliense]MBN3129918.1 hypothetical protein [Pectobacterium brasiliense]